MCLRLNKDVNSDGHVMDVAQMREPAGYLGEIVRRMKYRAVSDGGVPARVDVAGRTEACNKAQNNAKSR